MSELAARLKADGGLLAQAVVDPAGPGEPSLVLDAVREGYLQHYGEGRVLRSDDADLALLAGDRLYALGLALLAEQGDLDAVAVLADLISRCAQAQAEERPQDAEAAWQRARAALGR